MRTVFFISDRTGITAEALGNSLLTQFPKLILKESILPLLTLKKRHKQQLN